MQNSSYVEISVTDCESSFVIFEEDTTLKTNDENKKLQRQDAIESFENPTSAKAAIFTVPHKLSPISIQEKADNRQFHQLSSQSSGASGNSLLRSFQSDSSLVDIPSMSQTYNSLPRRKKQIRKRQQINLTRHIENERPKNCSSTWEISVFCFYFFLLWIVIVFIVGWIWNS